MKGFKGTNGKWSVGRKSDNKLEIYMNGNYRAKVFGYGATITEEDIANAKLIAAAPEMLSALLKIKESINKMELGSIEGLYDEIEEVTNKALRS